MATKLIASTEIVFNPMNILTEGKPYVMTLKEIDNNQLSKNARKLSYAIGTVVHMGKVEKVRVLIMKRTSDEIPTFEEGGSYTIVPQKNGTWMNAVLLTPEKEETTEEPKEPKAPKKAKAA